MLWNSSKLGITPIELKACFPKIDWPPGTKTILSGFDKSIFLAKSFLIFSAASFCHFLLSVKARVVITFSIFSNSSYISGDI